MVVVDNCTALDSSDSAGPHVQTLCYRLASKLLSKGLAAGLFFGHLHPFSFETWDCTAKRRGFNQVTCDLTYHGALQEALGVTRNETQDLTQALCIHESNAVDTNAEHWQERIWQLLDSYGTQASTFASKPPIDAAEGFDLSFLSDCPFEITVPSNATFRPVYPITDVLRALRELGAKTYEEVQPPQITDIS